MAIRGQNVAIFEKRFLLDFIKGRLWFIFQTPPNMSSKKKKKTGKFVGKIVRNPHFAGEGKIVIRVQVCFENLW